MSDYYVPRRGIILARISDAKNGDTKGVDGQVKLLRADADQRGWGIGPDGTHVIVENDTSAFKRYATCPACMRRSRQCTCPPLPMGQKRRVVMRTWRPGFRRALEMLEAGDADGLLALDLDRAMRDPRDLEDLIDVVRKRVPGIAVDSHTGSLRELHTSSGVQTARILIGVAVKSSEDTARRVSQKRKMQAEDGVFGGGPRRYGFGVPVLDEAGRPVLDEKTGRPRMDMMAVVDAEAAEIRKMTELLLSGVTLKSAATARPPHPRGRAARCRCTAPRWPRCCWRTATPGCARPC